MKRKRKTETERTSCCPTSRKMKKSGSPSSTRSRSSLSPRRVFRRRRWCANWRKTASDAPARMHRSFPPFRTGNMFVWRRENSSRRSWEKLSRSCWCTVFQLFWIWLSPRTWKTSLTPLKAAPISASGRCRISTVFFPGS